MKFKRLSLTKTIFIYIILFNFYPSSSAQDWEESDDGLRGAEALTTPPSSQPPKSKNNSGEVKSVNADEPTPPPVIFLEEWETLKLPQVHSLKDEPWVICLSLTGSSLTHLAQVYTAQPRYGTWNAHWLWLRPTGYTSEEEVGLLTAQKLQQSLTQITSITHQEKFRPQLFKTVPPCTQEEIKQATRIPKRSAPFLLAQLWVLAPEPVSDPVANTEVTEQFNEADHVLNTQNIKKNPSSSRVWYYWSVENPHLSENEAFMTLIKEVKTLVYEVAPQRDVLDSLLKPEEQATLTLFVSHPSHIWINEVYQGRWPSHQKIHLPGGYYQIRATPLDSKRESLSYEGVEVLKGRSTTFRISFD